MPFMRARLCPQCGSEETYPSRNRTLADRLIKLIGIRRYRCHDCNSFHFGWRGMKRSDARKPEN